MELHEAIRKVEGALSEDSCSSLIKYVDITCKEKAKLLVGNKNIEIPEDLTIEEMLLTTRNQNVMQITKHNQSQVDAEASTFHDSKLLDSNVEESMFLT